MGWRILTYRLAAEQSRHRVAVWRELRRAGALALQAATWAVPTGGRFDEGMTKALALVERAGGQAMVFDVVPAEPGAAALEEMYTAEREAEWVEFCSECDKAEAELHGEIAKEKFTLAELDEEEQAVERLRRWYREIHVRDLFGAPSAAEAERRLKACVEVLEDFAERVYEVGQLP